MNPGFLVEDGSGLANSTSYITTDSANSYLSMYGEGSAWNSQSIDNMQGALMLASQCIDIQYGQKFYGLVNTSGAPIQGLLWPRFVLVVNRIQIIQQVIPVQLARATAEIALMQVQGTDIFPAPNPARFIKNQVQKIGSIEVSTTYFRAYETEMFTGFWKIEQILKPLLMQDSTPSFMSL